jgi:hypothetical protein
MRILNHLFHIWSLNQSKQAVIAELVIQLFYLIFEMSLLHSLISERSFAKSDGLIVSTLP